MAEMTGFEPARGCPQHAFQACALNRSATSPLQDGVTIPNIFLSRKF